MSGEQSHDTVFADTCVLLNFVQQEYEHNRSTALIESESITIVVSPNVLDELASVSERRHDIYEDMLDFLVKQNRDIDDYDPADRRVYIGKNDRRHVYDILMTLANVDDRRDVLRRLRQFVRATDRRVDHLEVTLEENTVDPLAPFGLELALGRLLNHNADARIVTDAAGWAADGGSGVLVTLDGDDLLGNKESITDLITERQGTEWVIEIIPPDRIIS